MFIKKLLLGLVVLVPAILSIKLACAHHAFSAEFDGDKYIEFKGVVTKVEWVNPHSWIYVDVKDSSGNTVNWAIEFGGPAALLRRGVRREDLPVGSQVSVAGYRAKNGKSIIAGDTVVLPNGKSFYSGAEGGR